MLAKHTILLIFLALGYKTRRFFIRSACLTTCYSLHTRGTSGITVGLSALAESNKGGANRLCCKHMLLQINVLH